MTTPAVRKEWRRTGFILVALGILQAPLSNTVRGLLRLAHIDNGLKCGDFEIKIGGYEFGLLGILVIAGVLCILPIAEWLTAWKSGKKK